MPIRHPPIIDVARAYHSKTKHHVDRMSPSAGYLDWANQPDPFRTFEGSQRINLHLIADPPGATYGDIHVPGRITPVPVDIRSIGILFELALGLSAWKEYGGNRWALRCNPSSGNLHPTEGYAILPPLPGIESGGVYHYLSRDHCLELRSALNDASSLPDQCFLVGFSSIHWRESWKYGERAFRYCQHDMGHAIASLRYAAGVLGWSAILLENPSDANIAAALGLDHQESFSGLAAGDGEHPGVLLQVGPDIPTDSTARSAKYPIDFPRLQTELAKADWSGRANALSNDHVHWPMITEVARATWRGDEVETEHATATHLPVYARTTPPANAARLIQQRRSAVALDDTTSISARTFYGMLDCLLPRAGVPPWDAWPWPPHLHCVIFVHRVEGLPQGLCLFERNSTVHETLRAAMRPDFAFDIPKGCPEHLRLFYLSGGDFRQEAAAVSCRQQIAGAGTYSLGMIAEFGGSIEAKGAWWYRRLFWEAGLLGHVLYLEAEAAGVRGTGIGCYFDDAFHDMLGIQDDEFQSLYHFTVGGPIEDTRLMTRPGYFHLGADRKDS